MDAQTTLPVTCENIAVNVAADGGKVAADTGTVEEQQTPLSDEDLMPFYFLSMAGGY